MKPAVGRWLIALAAVVLASSGCAHTSEPVDAPTAPSRISQAGTLRVCTTGDYRPFTYRDEQGQWSGLDVEMAGDLARRLDVSLSLVPTTWKTLMSDIGNRCDVAMGGISIKPDRAERALFSDPYLRDGKAGIARCTDRDRFHDLADIDRPGVRVIVNPGGGNAAFDDSHLHQARVITWPDNNTIFSQLAAGAADVMITDTSEIRWQTTVDSRLCGFALEQPFTAEEKAYLLPKTSGDLQQSINQWLSTAMHDGTYAALSQKYFGRSTGP